MKIFIIIVNYKSKDIDKCLNSLKKLNSKFQTIIIDNSKKNRGFAAGCNLGIQKALRQHADYVLLLNPDTIIEDEYLLEKLLKNKADIIAPVIKFKRHHKWLYDFGGKVNWWIGRTKHINKNQKPETRNQKPRKKIDYVSGCCMLIKRNVFAKIGLFDERFFLYFEDVDFCLRAKKAGLKITVEPKTMIYHQLKPALSKIKSRNLIRSNLLFINKWLSRWKKPLGWLYTAMLALKLLVLKK